MRWRRGRHRCPRWVEMTPETTLFRPAGIPPGAAEVVVMTFAELEALRLADLEGMTQEEAARQMGISRRTFWDDLMRARKKVVYALVNGCTIQIVGGDYAVPPSAKIRRR
ncbi:MAG: DUF134 domain-containing protein [Candidatus Thermoplasmatota archaeon]